ncbi:tyrosine-type recombinase/integrase [Nocardioides sp. NPDC101246]|uniref:tyrosine-type recombinase/integrase n=1 Tax=Nocardioides sp. NPDC101246 TaxID=3364336 RepID=UPI0038193FAD
MTNDALSYDVRIYKIETRKRTKVTNYRTRWSVNGERFGEPFATRKLAESYRSALQQAASRGEAFDTRSGLPRSLGVARAGRTWVEVAREFIDDRWEDFAPRHRKSTAEGLVTLTCALVKEGKTPPDDRALRQALKYWEFNTAARTTADDPPDEHREAVRWISENSRPVSYLNELDGVKAAIDALSRKLDGSKAAKSTIARKRAALSGVLNFAVERDYLEKNLMSHVRTPRRPNADAIDPGVVVNPDQARALLDAVLTIDPTLHALFAASYYAGLRPAEARNLREGDLKLPEAGWGEIILRKGYQESGSAWTDDGKRGEERGLKHRDEDTTRPVPAHPDLVKALRRHLDEHGTGVEGRLFVTRVGRGGKGGVPLPPPYQNPVNQKTVYRAWESARAEALKPRQYASALARTPYDLRHACVSTWLSAGVDATQVAKWAGHSVAVLLRVYAACLDDTENAAKARIEQAMKTDPDA